MSDYLNINKRQGSRLSLVRLFFLPPFPKFRTLEMVKNKIDRLTTYLLIKLKIDKW